MLLGETQTPHFYDFGIFERVLFPSTNYFCLWIPQDTLTHPRNKPKSCLENRILGSFKIVEVRHFEKWKRQAPTNDEDPSNIILKILDMGSISIQKYEMGTW